MSPLIKEKAPIILAEIKKAKSILLHCHPSPDPDSVGSALAMKFAVEQLGKKATVIQGDSEIPLAFGHLPGVGEIVEKKFSEVELGEYDLFLILDTASPEMITRYKELSFPLQIKTIVIDHHASNHGFADINLVESTFPATSQILYDLFVSWDIKVDRNIAANLFMGLYTDTGGFKYPGTTVETFEVAGHLVQIVPEFPKLISEMENSKTLAELRFQALALNSVETFLGGQIGLSVISLESMKSKNISAEDIHAEEISPMLRSVSDWKVSGIMIEVEPEKIKMSFRSKDGDLYDVSKLAKSLGGGGHKAASGARLDMPIESAKNLVVSKIKEMYNL